MAIKQLWIGRRFSPTFLQNKIRVTCYQKNNLRHFLLEIRKELEGEEYEPEIDRDDNKNNFAITSTLVSHLCSNSFAHVRSMVQKSYAMFHRFMT